MSEEAVGNLRIDVTVQLAKMQAQFDDMNRRVRSLNNKLNSEFRAMARGIQSALGAIGISLAPAALIAYGRSVVNLAGQITDLAAAAGVNTTAFQALSLHFMDSGVSMEEMSKAFVRLRKATQEAVEGNKTAQASFAALGLDPAKLQTHALERQLEFLAVSINNATDKNKAFNAALDILGAKGAPKLMAALKELGVQGFDAIAAKSAKWQLTPAQLKSFDDLGDKLAYIWKMTQLISLQGADAAAKGWAAGPTKTGQTGWKGGNKNMFGEMPAIQPQEQTIEQWRAVFKKIADEAKAAAAKAKADADALAGVAATRPLKDRSIDKITIDFKAWGEAQEKNTEKLRQWNKEMDASAQGYKDIIDPTLKFKRQMEDVKELLRIGKLSADDASESIRRLKEAMAEDESARVEQSLNKFFGPLDDKQRELEERTSKMKGAANDLGWAFASSFEEAILSGKKFSDVLKGLGRDLLQIMLRRMITIPIANALTGAIGSIGGFAEGGDPPVNKASVVGEKGPELFVPKVAGTVIPNSAFTGGGSGRGKGDTINIDARGADRGQLTRLEGMIRDLYGSFNQRVLAASSDMRRRVPA